MIIFLHLAQLILSGWFHVRVFMALKELEHILILTETFLLRCMVQSGVTGVLLFAIMLGHTCSIVQLIACHVFHKPCSYKSLVYSLPFNKDISQPFFFFELRPTSAQWWLSSPPEYSMVSPVAVECCTKLVYLHPLTPRMRSLYCYISLMTCKHCIYIPCSNHKTCFCMQDACSPKARFLLAFIHVDCDASHLTDNGNLSFLERFQSQY